MSKSIAEFDHEIRALGFSILRGAVASELLERMREDIPRRQAICREAQVRNGILEGMEGSAHHIVGGDDSLAEFIYSCPADPYIAHYFDGPYILNSYGALNNPPNRADVYKHGMNFHRDVRTYGGEFRLMLNMLLMVDDFTEENGATKVVPGSHRIAERPDDAFLEANAVRATGKAGDIVLFDSNLWHSAAPNYTDKPRMAVTPTFSRPFMKQQMDYPRMLGDGAPADERIRQLLGYNARVPANYDEWYQPPERRMYKPGQG